MIDSNEKVKRCTTCAMPKTRRAFRYSKRTRSHHDVCRSCEAIVAARSGAQKKCLGCGAVRPIEDFHRNKKSPDGRLTECRRCRARVYRGGGSVSSVADCGPSLADVRRAEERDRAWVAEGWNALRANREAVGQ